VTKGEETRSAVLGEAIAQASVVGLRGVTIGTLATKAGLSKSGLFAHFRSKESLQLGILEEAITRFIALVIAPSLKEARGKPRVAALLGAWKRWARSEFMPGGCIFVSAIAEIDDLEPAVRARLVEAQLDWLDTLAQAIRIAQDDGHFRKDLDATQMALEVLSLAYGHHLLGRLLRLSGPGSSERTRAPRRTSLSPAEIEARLDRAITRLFRDAQPRDAR
jgi:AcrR family transcriptional regulator